jgi:G:T-mismatch repair DNA endonuclease (very short patch repair protein)
MVFSTSDKDKIRTEEQKHEAELKKLLKKHGIVYNAEDIRPFGMRIGDKKPKTDLEKLENLLNNI